MGNVSEKAKKVSAILWEAYHLSPEGRVRGWKELSGPRERVMSSTLKGSCGLQFKECSHLGATWQEESQEKIKSTFLMHCRPPPMLLKGSTQPVHTGQIPWAKLGY